MNITPMFEKLLHLEHALRRRFDLLDAEVDRTHGINLDATAEMLTISRELRAIYSMMIKIDKNYEERLYEDTKTKDET